ncbi:MAG: hypothetical protein Q7U01_16785 [Pseudomonas sp.]|nr:hypothetical protein [Pseudomonas sp.]
MSRDPMLSFSRALFAVTLMLGLSACSLQSSQSGNPTPQVSGKPHPHFAPPPQGQSHWDSKLGVHVIENTPDLYYRERTYYHWNNGWSWAVQPNGPWQACPNSAVPQGLSQHYN